MKANRLSLTLILGVVAALAPFTASARVAASARSLPTWLLLGRR
jgi:hypothetical protein